MADIDEKKVAGASYIITFYKDIQQITSFYAQYNNLILELKAKSKADIKETGEIRDIPEETQEVYKVLLQNIRYYVSTCYIQYKTLKKPLNLKSNSELEEGFKIIKNNYVIKVEDLEKFTICINSVLVEGVIKSLLETSEGIVGGVYGDKTTAD